MQSKEEQKSIPVIDIPLAVPNLGGNEEKYLKECVSSNFVSSVGPFVGMFENQLAKRLKSNFVVATNSGTSALHLMLLSAGVKPGDLVIIPSYSFIATANAVSMAGATPWFIDIELESWGINPDLLRSELVLNSEKSGRELVHKPSGARIGAIMPVYAAGHPPRVSELTKIAKDFEVPIVFDSAAAIGSKVEGQELGESEFPHAISFNGNKTITCGGGGAVALNSETLAKAIKHLSTTARTEDGYSHDKVGFNYRLTNVQAAIGVAQLEQLETFLQRKREIAERYQSEFNAISGGNFPSVPSDVPSYWISGIVLKESHAGDIVRITNELASRGIQARESWRPIHEMLPYKKCVRSDMTFTNSLTRRVLTLPNSTSLTAHDQEKVIQSVRDILTRL